MIDAKQHLLGIHRVRQAVEPIMLRLASFQPPQRPLTGGLGICIGRRIFHALIKRHGNITAQMRLDTHAFLRPHKNPVAVQMGSKGHALFLNLTETGKGKHLKAAAVSQNRAIPPHELVKTSQGLDHVITGTKMKMVGIAQFDLTTQLFFQVERIDAAFDGSLRTHVHEYRGLYHTAMRALELSAPGAALLFDHFEHILLLFMVNG